MVQVASDVDRRRRRRCVALVDEVSDDNGLWGLTERGNAADAVLITK